MKFDVLNYIHESNLIEGIDNPAEDVQSLKAWEFLGGTHILTLDVLKKLHRLITKNQLPLHHRGKTRSELRVNVFIGDRIGAEWYLCGHILSNWIIDYEKKANDPLKAHINYEFIHPWIDGNGRTGRMILWWHELNNNQMPTLFLNSEKYEKYYPLFK